MGQVYNRQTGSTLFTSPGCQTVSSVSLIVVCGFFCLFPVALSATVPLRIVTVREFSVPVSVVYVLLEH